MYNWRGVPRGDTQACANPPLIRERAVSALLPLTTIVRADVLMLNPRRDFLRPSPSKRTREGGWDRRRKRRVTGVCPRACKHNFNTHYLVTRCACSHTRHRPDAHGQSCNVGDTRPMSTKSSTNTPQNLSKYNIRCTPVASMRLWPRKRVHTCHLHTQQSCFLIAHGGVICRPVRFAGCQRDTEKTTQNNP